jgi:hypothetical protein
MNNDTVTLAIAGANVTLPAATLTALWLEKVRGDPAPVALERVMPAIGSAWFGQGGIYAGIVRGDAGQPDYDLIVADAARENINWNDAMKWAGVLDVSGLHDFALPLRKEQAILFGNVPELFAKEWYWSREEHASTSDCAWCQYFDYGHQHYYLKSIELRARAVRRVAICQFDPLTI